MISPGCAWVMAFAIVCWRLARPSGPRSLYQERSIRWEAIFWPPVSIVFVLMRCIVGLKYPRDREKL